METPKYAARVRQYLLSCPRRLVPAMPPNIAREELSANIKHPLAIGWKRKLKQLQNPTTILFTDGSGRRGGADYGPKVAKSQLRTSS